MSFSTKIIVGMSGGVDSSVAAFLLHKQGYHVEGLFMKNWEADDRDDYCAAAKDAEDAKLVAEKIGIPFHTVNFAKQYWDKVFEYFLQEYQAGRTPNPDVLCNKEIKFKAFLDYAQKNLQADYIATGHYARGAIHNGQRQLLKAIDHNKDQSYFLYLLNQQQLAAALFPLGELTKPQVREIAREQGFITHDKKDSTGICFIGERKFKDFLQEYLPAKPGKIVALDDQTIVGKHDGLMYYTMGQRQGLQIGGLKEGSGAAWYVAGKDIKQNILYVVQGEDHPALFKSTLQCEQVHWISEKEPSLPLNCCAKIRYRQQDVKCSVEKLSDGRYQVNFAEPQRAVTPGQSIVFYQGDECLGGGIIQ